MTAAFNEAIAQLVPQARRVGVAALELVSGRAVCRVPLAGNGDHLGTM
ncbi:hypothetical protein ACOBQX_22240 [Actinokineospora sp. G85]